MITKWWKEIVKTVLAQANNTYGFNVPIKNVENVTYYPTGTFTMNSAFTLTKGNVGIHVGSGNRAATAEDIWLETAITSGLSGTVTLTKGVDNGKPYVQFNVVLSNTTQNDITVNEICYKINVSCAQSVGGTSASNRTIMIDRTVLPEPVIVPAAGNAAILYTLKTDYSY